MADQERNNRQANNKDKQLRAEGQGRRRRNRSRRPNNKRRPAKNNFKQASYGDLVHRNAVAEREIRLEIETIKNLDFDLDVF